MRIGEVARELDLTTRTIRFYESKGLLAPPDRAPNGYRRYRRSDVERLAFIRRAAEVGLTLDEIQVVLSERDSGVEPCARVVDLLQQKRQEVDEMIGDLARFRDRLDVLIAVGRTLDPADCTDPHGCHVLTELETVARPGLRGE